MTDSAELGNAMSILSQALRKNDDKIFLDAAESLLSICEQGKISNRFRPVALAYSALSYEISGESVRARNPYHELRSSLAMPTEASIEHDGILRDFNKLLHDFGVRDVDHGLKVGNKILHQIKGLNKTNDARFADSRDDEIVVFLGIVEGVISYLECLKNYNLSKLGDLSKFLQECNNGLTKFNSSSWLTMIARLIVLTIDKVAQRSILRTEISKSVGLELVNNGIAELWPTQNEAVNEGILRGNNLLLATSTATGKTLLSTILAFASTKTHKTVLISPTRTLAHEIFTTVTNHLKRTDLRTAISTRETAENDVNLSEYSVLVATYEKFVALLRREMIHKNHIRSIVIDEIHNIADADRGIQLEFLIKDIKNLPADRMQILALSGMLNSDNLRQLSQWIGAKAIHSKWRPIELEETVFFNNKIHYRNGSVESIPSEGKLPKTGKKEWLTRRLAIKEMEKKNQTMVVMMSRSKAEQECKKLLNILQQPQLFENPSQNDSNLTGARFSKMIKNVEPELPPFALPLASMIENGIAYHHAGLPEKYRLIVEDAVRKNIVKILFTTTTLEAGVNLPVATVIFPYLSSSQGQYAGSMSVNKYKNLAGRAGRPRFDRKGRSIIIAISENECNELLEKYVKRDTSEISSSIRHFLRNNPASRYAVQSEILNSLANRDSLSENELLKSVEDTWFAKTESAIQNNKFKSAFLREIRKLEQYECITKSNEKYSLGELGRSANKSMLYAFSMTRIIRNLQKIIIYDGQKFDILILSLVALPWELNSHDAMMKSVTPAEEVKFVQEIIRDDPRLNEKYQREKFVSKFATVLWYWINSVPTVEIIKKCKLDETYSAHIEEILMGDAYWVLNTIYSRAADMVDMNESKKNRIKELAEYCKNGSSDSLVLDIFKLHLTHVYRSTAIKLAMYFKKRSYSRITIKDLQLIPEKTFLDLFLGNEDSAKVLYDEIHQK